MWTVQNVIALVVAISGAAVSIGIFLQKVAHLTAEVAKLDATVKELRRTLDKTKYSQGTRLGEIERWIAATMGIADGRPPRLAPRHETRGVPVPPLLPREDSTEHDEEGGGGGG